MYQHYFVGYEGNRTDYIHPILVCMQHFVSWNVSPMIYLPNEISILPVMQRLYSFDCALWTFYWLQIVSDRAYNCICAFSQYDLMELILSIYKL